MDCHTESARCTSIGRPSVLIVDDEAAVCRMLSTYFSENGFRTKSVGSGTEMVGCLEAGRYDLVLLDLNMGTENGLDFLRALNSDTRPPIIIISARKHPVDKVVGLELGAEDYIGKPFHLREVLARARKALRNAKDRAGQASPTGVPHHTGDTADSDTIAFEGWQLSPRRRRLLAPDGSEVHLTSGEFAILLVFIQNSGVVLSRTQLMDATHGPGFSAYDRSIDAQVSRLRKKMQARPEWPDLFKPVRGAGYIFAARIERRRCRAA